MVLFICVFSCYVMYIILVNLIFGETCEIKHEKYEKKVFVVLP